jgi:hypothetical protein
MTLLPSPMSPGEETADTGVVSCIKQEGCGTQNVAKFAGRAHEALPIGVFELVVGRGAHWMEIRSSWTDGEVEVARLRAGGHVGSHGEDN